jgi:hypothetical protein
MGGEAYNVNNHEEFSEIIQKIENSIKNSLVFLDLKISMTGKFLFNFRYSCLFKMENNTKEN